MSKTIGYARVSTRDQHLDRQIDDFHKLGIDDKNIYTDEASGKNMDRIGYQYMKKCLEKRRYFSYQRFEEVRKKQERDIYRMAIFYGKWN